MNKFQSEIGDALRGGDPGVRLFDAHLSADRSSQLSQPAAYFTAIPAPFTRRESEWLIVPIEHIFGSEELSLQSPPVAELAPGPYLALNAADAAASTWKMGLEKSRSNSAARSSACLESAARFAGRNRGHSGRSDDCARRGASGLEPD